MADAPPPDPDYVASVYRDGLGDARRARARPPRRGGGLRALPGLLGAVGVGAAVREGGAACRPRARRSLSARASRAGLPAGRATPTSARATSRSAARSSAPSRACSAETTTATRATTRRTRCTPSAARTARSAATVRLYPLDGGRALEGRPARRAARLPPRARSAARSCASRSRTAGERGGARMVAMIQLPNVRFFAPSAGRATARRDRIHGVDAPADGDRAQRGPGR